MANSVFTLGVIVMGIEAASIVRANTQHSLAICSLVTSNQFCFCFCWSPRL